MLEIIIQFVKCPTHPKKQLAINKKPSSEIIVPSVKIKLLKKKKKKKYRGSDFNLYNKKDKIKSCLFYLGHLGLEPRTSPLSGVRSSHLS